MVTGAGTTNFAYDAADRLTSVTPPGQSAVSYGWDDNGNLTSRGADSFSWDAEDRLTSATVSSVTTTFTYNGDGLRDSLTTGGNTTTFTWDVNRSIPQVLDDEDLRYVYGIGRIAQVSGSSTHYYLSDGLGSTMALTDADGDVVNDYDYDVFGGLRDSSGSQDNDFTFAGEQVDGSTGLQYLRARYYDMAVGRFVSRDPIVPAAGLANSLYLYGWNNPSTLIDPTGYWPSCGFCNKVADAGGKVAGHVLDKGKDAITTLDNCVDSYFSTCPSDAVALGISIFSTGDRRTGPNGFVLYENCVGLCSLINGAFDLIDDTRAFTPGFISFAEGTVDPTLFCHEYQHYIQSRIFGPLYFILGFSPMLEDDARATRNDYEGHVPFTDIPLSGRCRDR
jgi:RHS repeat-associated protein